MLGRQMRTETEVIILYKLKSRLSVLLMIDGDGVLTYMKEKHVLFLIVNVKSILLLYLHHKKLPVFVLDNLLIPFSFEIVKHERSRFGHIIHLVQGHFPHSLHLFYLVLY